MFAAWSHRWVLFVGLLGLRKWYKNWKLGKNREILLSVVQRVKDLSSSKANGEVPACGGDWTRKRAGLPLLTRAVTSRGLFQTSYGWNGALVLENSPAVLLGYQLVTPPPFSALGGFQPQHSLVFPLKLWFCGAFSWCSLEEAWSVLSNSCSKSPRFRPCLVFTI